MKADRRRSRFLPSRILARIWSAMLIVALLPVVAEGRVPVSLLDFGLEPVVSMGVRQGLRSDRARKHAVSVVAVRSYSVGSTNPNPIPSRVPPRRASCRHCRYSI